jgi:signal transduction histidine kinase
MAQGGKLTVATKQKKETKGSNNRTWIEVSITDTGQGVEKKHLDKIFDPFFTLKGHGKGTGLGLSITYGIIKDHGGGIDFASKIGKGTVVKITLPAFDQQG